MDEPSRTVWITRAQPGAAATADRVRALGHTPIVAPLLDVRELGEGPPDLGGVAALAFTSANAVRAFARRTPDRSLRVFAVGAATARAAREAGFRRVLSSDGDVAALARGIAARRRELKGVILHPGAAEPAGDLEGELSAAGLEARRLDLYETAPSVLSDADMAATSAARTALVHSPKAGRILAQHLKDRPNPDLTVLAISRAALEPLDDTPLAGRAASPFPLEAALLNLIDRSA